MKILINELEFQRTDVSKAGDKEKTFVENCTVIYFDMWINGVKTDGHIKASGITSKLDAEIYILKLLSETTR